MRSAKPPNGIFLIFFLLMHAWTQSVLNFAEFHFYALG
jgi:hypothetical protein